MSYLLIRHGEKAHNNSGVGPDITDPSQVKNILDSPLRDIPETLQLANKMLDLVEQSEIPLPDILVMSPFQRTRQTGEIIENLLRERGHDQFRVIYDFSLGEYLGNQRRNLNIGSWKNPLPNGPFHPETLHYGNPRIHGNQNEYSMEVCQSVRRYIDNYPDSSVWFVTHSLAIKNIAGNLGYDIDELGMILLRPKDSSESSDDSQPDDESQPDDDFEVPVTEIATWFYNPKEQLWLSIQDESYTCKNL